MLTALQQSGTRHVYADSADVEEILALGGPGGTIPSELDGNTANQPLVRKVIERYLDQGEPESWERELSAHREKLLPAELLVDVYTIVCGRIGNDMARVFGGDHPWETSIQIHMSLCRRPEAAIRVGHLLRKSVPGAFIKVPFTPDAPDCFLVARDLERAGIPVNFTSTFSARQAVCAALLADVSRTNIFMGRLNAGLGADLLGDHVDLEAQRAIRGLRESGRSKTELIVASMRGWRTFVRTAGCDVYTAPVPAIRDFLSQKEVDPEQIENRLSTSYEGGLGVTGKPLERLGAEGVERLFRVESDLITFLEEYRESPEFEQADGQMLERRFREAGFGDLFHVPDAKETEEMKRGKLPDMAGRMIGRIPIDTHYSLLANADFERYQEEMDGLILERLGRKQTG